MGQSPTSSNNSSLKKSRPSAATNTPLAKAYPRYIFKVPFTISSNVSQAGMVWRLRKTPLLVSFLVGWLARLTHRPDDGGSKDL
jgi:hypothetical protein